MEFGMRLAKIVLKCASRSSLVFVSNDLSQADLVAIAPTSLRSCFVYYLIVAPISLIEQPAATYNPD
jgi:hypothetical protein